MKFDASALQIEQNKIEPIKERDDRVNDRLDELKKERNIQLDKSYYVQTQNIVYKGKEQSSRAWQVWGIIIPPIGKRETKPLAQKYIIRDGRESVAVSSRNNWYDVGHLMALSLGGSDDKRNYILQAPGKNEHGAWSKLEDKVKRAANTLLDEDQPNIIFFGVTAVYKQAPKNIFEVYIPERLKVYLYKIPYADYKELKISAISPEESYSKLSKYHYFIPIEKISENTTNASTTLTPGYTIHEQHGYTEFSNMLDEPDIVKVLENLANQRIEAVIQYLQGENLFALVVGAKNKQALKKTDGYKAIKKEHKVILEINDGKEFIDVSAKLNDIPEDVAGCFGYDSKHPDVDKVLDTLEVFLERSHASLDKQEAISRDKLNIGASSSTSKIAVKAEELTGISLPSIDEDIASFFHYKLAFAEQRDKSPAASQEILEQGIKDTKQKIEKEPHKEHPVLKNKLKNYYELESSLIMAHGYLDGREPLNQDTQIAAESGSSNSEEQAQSPENTEPPTKKSKKDPFLRSASAASSVASDKTSSSLSLKRK